MSIILSSDEDASLSRFTQNLVDVWNIRKKDTGLNLGFFPSDENVIRSIMKLLQSSAMIDCERWLWSDTTKENYLTDKNFIAGEFIDFNVFYESYMHGGGKNKDPIVKLLYSNPDTTIRKYAAFNPKEYRKLDFYNQYVSPYIIEDALISTFLNPISGITTFLASYRTDIEEKYFFTDEERQKQHFIYSFLALNSRYPIAICDEKGGVKYDETDFWRNYREEHPNTPLILNKLPSVLLADLIKWNHADSSEKRYNRVCFKVLQYNKLYCIQAIPKTKEIIENIPKIIITEYSKDPIKKPIDKVEETRSIYSVNPIRRKPKNPVLCSDNKNNVLELNIMGKEREPIKPKKLEGDLSIDNPDNLISIVTLQRQLEEKDQEIDLLKQQISTLEKENTQLKEITTDYKNSVANIVDNPELPEKETLTLPEKAPVLFTGKQAESLDFLEEHYGKYLTYFGAKKNLLFQYQLKTLDKNLYSSTRNRVNYLRRKDKSIPIYAEIVLPKTKAIDLAIESTSLEERKKMFNLDVIAKRRKKMFN